MNTIRSSSGESEIYDKKNLQLAADIEQVKLTINLNKTYSVNIISHQDNSHQNDGEYIENKNDTEVFKNISHQVLSKACMANVDDNYPLDLSLPKMNTVCYGEINSPGPENSHLILKSLSLQNQHDAKDKQALFTHQFNRRRYDVKTESDKCTIVYEACLPGTYISSTARRYNIPHQYIFTWCKRYYNMSIAEFKIHLIKKIDHLKYNKILSIQDIALIKSIKKPGKKINLYNQEHKKIIINEACKYDINVHETARRYNVHASTIYRWCKKIYNLNLKCFKQKQLQTQINTSTINTWQR